MDPKPPSTHPALGLCPPVGQQPRGKLAIAGLLLGAGYQLVNIMAVVGLFLSVSFGLGGVGLDYATTQQDKLITVALATLGTALPTLMLIPAALGVAFALYTAWGLTRGAPRARLYSGALGSLIGLSAYVVSTPLGLLVLGAYGALPAALALGMTVVSLGATGLTLSLVAAAMPEEP